MARWHFLNNGGGGGALPPICVALARSAAVVDSTLKSVHMTHFACVMVFENGTLSCEQVEPLAFFDRFSTRLVVSRVATSDSHMLIIADGQLFSVGCNSKEQLGLPSSAVASTKQLTLVDWLTSVVVVDCAVGDEHSVCVRSDGRCFTFGANDDGQCGVGAPSKIANAACETSARVERVACGPNTTYLIADDGSVYACGFNSHGELVCVLYECECVRWPYLFNTECRIEGCR